MTAAPATRPATPLARPLRDILDLARWAPSGDNTQPWRFEVIGPRHVVVHGFDTREHCVYDLDGRPSQISIGALLQTIRIAATAHRLRASVTRRPDAPEERPVFDVRFDDDASIEPSPLLAAIPMRSVQRRAMSMRPIAADHRDALAAALGPGWTLRWWSSLPERWRWTKLLWRNAGLRLRLPEAFSTHRDIIEWDARFSRDRIPDQALGADRLTLAMMRRAMAGGWARVDRLNRRFGGTIAPRLVMDAWPALACGAHVAIIADQAPRTVDDYVEAGHAVQRFWLTAERLGLRHQPAVTPLVFARYIRDQRGFCNDEVLVAQALDLRERLDGMLGRTAAQAVWLGRIGSGPSAASRSVRRPLDALRIGAPPLRSKSDA